MNRAEAKAKQIREYLEGRIASALEWYKDCDLVDETLENVRKDMRSLLEETIRKFDLKKVPFTLKVTAEDGFIVVRPLDKKLD